MNKKNFIYNMLIAAATLVMVQGCDSDDDESGSSTDFASIASSYLEADGTGIHTIPLRNASGATNLNVSLAGSATEGADYEYIGLTAEGIQIRILDDADLEFDETIRVTVGSANGNLSGNAIHTVTIVSNCEDVENPFMKYFVGDFDATEKYGPTPGSWYGPYVVHFVQDEDDPNIIHFDNLYDSGCDAYMVFDLEAGTVYFPDQSPCGVDLTNSSGTFTIDECNGSELNITLNFDGGDWLYTFKKLKL